MCLSLATLFNLKLHGFGYRLLIFNFLFLACMIRLDIRDSGSCTLYLLLKRDVLEVNKIKCCKDQGLIYQIPHPTVRTIGERSTDTD